MDCNKKIVSVILARGGSKGIPNKNIIDINGKPLIWYSIEASLNSKVDETWVSTDSKEISDVSKKCGSNVLDRPSELATDISQSDDSLMHFASKVDFDILVFIQPTSPLIKSKYIDNGIDMMCSGKYNSVFTAHKEHWIPRWNNDVEPIDWDVYKRPRRQDVQENYVENGMFYMTNKENLLTSKLRYSGIKGIVETDLKDSFQIDVTEDLKLVKKLIT